MSLLRTIEVRLASDEDAEWCARTAGWGSTDFARQAPSVLETVVGIHDGEPVGMLHLQYLWPGCDLPPGLPYIALVVVAEPHRRKGVGRAMLAFVEQRLRSKGYTVLLSSSTVNEPEPQAWHRRVGFQECGFISGHPFDDGLGELFFAKRLD